MYEDVRRLVAKSSSFGLGRSPINSWSYTSLQEHGGHFDEAAVVEWADGGFTVPQSPGYDPNSASDKEQIIHLLDWS